MLSQERFKQIKENPWFASVRGKLEHIQHFLHKELASCMVGAGFSRNAERDINVQVKDWEGLALDFYKRLYGGNPQKSDLSLKSALRLASQVECQYGRHELHRLIEEAVPNDKLKPGPLHYALVNLPWRDIFTTNYDQLLERTPSKYSYSIITNKETLLYKPHPRIIKLHGSFPDCKPYVISEEDYRTYPNQHPEFVNTVRQSLIESALCLFGFSGEDPNFLNWIGWIRDKMGKTLAPIYLFDVSETGYHESELSLLRERRIEIISMDFSLFQDRNEFFEFIFQFLGENPAEIEKGWSATMEFDFISKISGIKIKGGSFSNTLQADKLNELINRYRAIRESYPGWLFIPVRHLEDAFEDSFSRELHYIKPILKDIPVDKRKDLLFELEWRFRMSFVPVSLVPWYADAIKELISNLSEDEIINDYKLIVLSISLLSFYRQRYEMEKFEELAIKLSGVQYTTDTENIRHYLYERCLSAISVMDYPKARMILSLWAPAPEDYLGILWKTAIMTELGQNEEAYIMLRKAYTSLQNSYVTTHRLQYLDSTMAAYESVMRVYEPFTPQRHRKNNDWDEFLIYNYFRYEKERLYDRRDKLERDKFKNRTHEFNLNHVVNHYSMGAGSRELESQYAGRIQMVWESFGYPYLLGNMTINSTMMQLSSDSLLKTGNAPFALNVLIRSAQKDTIKSVLHKHIVSSIDKELVEHIFDDLMTKAESIKDWDESQLGQRMSVVVAEILRRFAVVLDEERIMRLVPLLLKIRESHQREYKNDYLRTIFNCVSKDNLKRVYTILACAPIETAESERDIIFPDLDDKVIIPDQAIEIIEKAFGSEDQYMRNNAYLRAARIREHCNEKQRERLNDLILNWRKKDMDVCINATYSFNVVPFDSSKETITPEVRISWAIDRLKKENSDDAEDDPNIVRYANKAEDELCVLEALTTFIPNDKQEDVVEILIEKLAKILISSEREKGVWEQAFGSSHKYDLSTISYIVTHLDYATISKERLKTLGEILVKLARYGYPKLYALYKINEESHILDPVEFEELLRRCVLSSDESIRKNSFNFMATIGFESYSNLWGIIWNKIQFSSSPEVAEYLSLVMDTCAVHPLPLNNIPNLSEILDSLKAIVEEDNLLDGDKFDVEYQIMRLVGYLSKSDKSESLTLSLNHWMPENNSLRTLPNDVKLGFDEGIDIWEKNHNA